MTRWPWFLWWRVNLVWACSVCSGHYNKRVWAPSRKGSSTRISYQTSDNFDGEKLIMKKVYFWNDMKASSFLVVFFCLKLKMTLEFWSLFIKMQHFMNIASNIKWSYDLGGEEKTFSILTAGGEVATTIAVASQKNLHHTWDTHHQINRWRIFDLNDNIAAVHILAF